jgi:hypothetical protein
MSQQGIKVLIKEVEPATQLLALVYILSIASLMNYHHDRHKNNVERVVTHSRVSLNSYNVMIVIKQNP